MPAQDHMDRQYRGITRTVCIGLGGTGRDVLMRLRRLIVDKYGKLDNLPIVSFVHIDTDGGASKVTGLSTGSSYQGEDISFRDSERVSAQISAAEVDDFIRAAGHHSGSQPGPYSHITQWFPPELLRNIRAIDQGAKGIRPVGRLAFFWNYRKIHTTIESAIQRTQGNETRLTQQQGLIVDPGLNIFVVGSLCGGTGSGMFLDTAYSLRNTYADVKVNGYLVISPELYGNHPSMCANTYAALMELDYYSRNSTKFEACFDQQLLKIVREQRPPFDFIYLVSNHTEQNKYSIHDQGKLCNVIAHKIALDFISELAPPAKSNRDNFLLRMVDMDQHPRRNCQRYLTFGMSAIYFPRERIAALAANRIKGKLLHFWLQGIGQSPEAQRLLEQFLMECRWHTSLEKKDGIINKLEATGVEANKPFRTLLNACHTKLDAAIDQCKNKEERTQVRQLLLRELREQFRKTLPGDTEATRGAWLTKLQQNRNQITQQFSQDVDQFLVKLLVPHESNFSIQNARNWLDSLQTELDRYQYALEERQRSFSLKTLEEQEKHWKQLEQLVADHEQGFRLYGKNSQIQDDLRQALRATEKAIQNNFDLAIALEALAVVGALQQRVQQLNMELTALYNQVSGLGKIYEREQEALQQLNLNEMSGLAIFAEEDIDRCAEVLLPFEDRQAQLVQMTNQVQTLGSRSLSLAGLIGSGQVSQTQLKQDIDVVLEQLCGSRSSSLVQSAIKRFNQSFASTAREATLVQVLREAEPLLPLRKDLYFDNDAGKSSRLIGFHDSDDLEVQQFKRVLKEHLQVAEQEIKPIQAEDQILFMSEYAAFPLRFIHGLEQYRLHYQRLTHSAHAFLHNERQQNRFTDIIPPDVEVMLRLEEVFYPCLGLGLIQENPEAGQLEFSYYDAALNEYEPISLNPDWSQALEMLVNRQDLRQCLEEQLSSKVNEITTNPSLWEGEAGYLRRLQQQIACIRNWEKDHINYDYAVKVAGAKASMDHSAQPGVLTRFIEEVNQKVALKGLQKSLTSFQGNADRVENSDWEN